MENITGQKQNKGQENKLNIMIHSILKISLDYFTMLM